MVNGVLMWTSWQITLTVHLKNDDLSLRNKYLAINNHNFLVNWATEYYVIMMKKTKYYQ